MLILASASPRRKELLEMAGFEFSCVPSSYQEDMSQECDVEELTKALALGKAEDILAQYPEAVVVGSDTVVAVDGKVLGKPADTADAEKMLSLLSGRVHTVSTGVAICTKDIREVFCVSAKVEFYPLAQKDIADYVATKEPMDKAGAYGIQGKGALLIKGIEGDFYTVMGLPIAELSRRLQKYEF